MQRLKAQARLTLYSVAIAAAALASSGCTTERAAVSLRPDIDHPAWFVCAPAGTRPSVPGEYVIDWSKVQTVDQAKTEHQKFVSVLRTREGVVSGYVLDLEGKLFACGNNLATLRQFYAGLPKDTAGGQAAPTPSDPH